MTQVTSMESGVAQTVEETDRKENPNETYDTNRMPETEMNSQQNFEKFIQTPHTQTLLTTIHTPGTGA